MSEIIIYTDGGARGNPGPAGAGVVAYENETKLFELKKYLGERQTNNWAEYEAVYIALLEAEKRTLQEKEIEIRMDSELIVKQMNGEYRIKEPALKLQHKKIQGILAHFSKYQFVHIPREKNAEADTLVNEAIDSAR